MKKMQSNQNEAVYDCVLHFQFQSQQNKTSETTAAAQSSSFVSVNLRLLELLPTLIEQKLHLLFIS